MPHIKVGFSTDKTDWISSVIRFATWSKYSHAVLISPDGNEFIEATHGIGVRKLPIEEFHKKHNVHIGYIWHPNPELTWEYAHKEVGKPYDEMYIYGWLARRNWQNDSMWACSELIPYAAHKAGYRIVREEYDHKISPEQLYMISTSSPT